MTAPAEPQAEPASGREAPGVIVLPPPADENKGRRKRSGSTKRQRVGGVFVRLSYDELARLIMDAETAELSVPAYLRTGRLGAEPPSRRTRRSRAPIDERLLARNNAALNQIGNNLNQTTRALNELVLIADAMGDGRLARLLGYAIERNREIHRDLKATLAANRRVFGDDSEG
jgi:hypothetical protein